MNQTTLIKTADINKKWYLIDAKDLVLGRLSSEIAIILRGKTKSDFTPHINNGDRVIVINADKIYLSGKKEIDKTYYHHSGYPGGLKKRKVNTQRELFPERIIERAVRLMLPKTKVGANQFRSLYVYKGSDHPHQAQNPIIWEPKYVKGVNK
ncbi:50S ribosomal protein L13 [Spiroplasma endosymbiont of Aspidapion aeneum]|uniref:50S ribosomal protein L13 n=1 Tax=Spiroplasma endosymbiont of Aspidapion aeneum TaxID=3066276 RepID=UPI00313A8E8E